jgi:DNA repair protein RecO (recombination protein O)
MAQEKVSAMVIKTYDAGESNLRVKLFCMEKGIITVFAKGAKNTKSRLLSPCQLFTYGKYILFKGNDFYSLSQGESIESFYEIRNDITKLAYASYLLELIEKTLPEEMEADDILRLLYMALEAMAKGKIKSRTVATVFAIKYVQLSGFLDMDGFCTSCGELEENMNNFSCQSGGFICRKCSGIKKDSICLSSGAVKAIEYVINNFGRKMFSFKISDSADKELFNLFELYVKIHMCDDLKTLDFAKKCDML